MSIFLDAINRAIQTNPANRLEDGSWLQAQDLFPSAVGWTPEKFSQVDRSFASLPPEQQQTMVQGAMYMSGWPNELMSALTSANPAQAIQGTRSYVDQKLADAQRQYEENSSWQKSLSDGYPFIAAGLGIAGAGGAFGNLFGTPGTQGVDFTDTGWFAEPTSSLPSNYWSMTADSGQIMNDAGGSMGDNFFSDVLDTLDAPPGSIDYGSGQGVDFNDTGWFGDGATGQSGGFNMDYFTNTPQSTMVQQLVNAGVDPATAVTVAQNVSSGMTLQNALSAARMVGGLTGSSGGTATDPLSKFLKSVGIDSGGTAGALLGLGLSAGPGIAALNYATNLPGSDTSRLESSYASIDPNALALPYDIQTGQGRERLTSSLTDRGVMGSSFGNQDLASYDTLRGLGRSNLLTSGASTQAQIAKMISDAQIASQKNKTDLYGRALLALSGGLTPAKTLGW